MRTSPIPRAPQLHTLSVVVENQAGVLARIAGLFARRNFNIYSLAVAPTNDERVSRITIVVDAEATPLEQVVRQLDKLINVLTITELAPGESVERELVLLTVEVEPSLRSQVTELAQIFDAKVLNVGHDALTLSLEGNPSKIDDFEALLRPYGLRHVQRTGRVALPMLQREAPALRDVSDRAG